MKLNPIPLVRQWLTTGDNDVSKPTLTDWYQHIPTYGGVAIMLALQTSLLVILFYTVAARDRAQE